MRPACGQLYEVAVKHGAEEDSEAAAARATKLRFITPSDCALASIAAARATQRSVKFRQLLRQTANAHLLLFHVRGELIHLQRAYSFTTFRYILGPTFTRQIMHLLGLSPRS